MMNDREGVIKTVELSDSLYAEVYEDGILLSDETYSEVLRINKGKELDTLSGLICGVSKNKPIGEIVLSEPDDCGYRSAKVVCLHEQADWDNFSDGTELYLNPPKYPREKPGKQQIIDGLMVAEGSLREQAMVWGIRKEEDLEKLMQMSYTLIRNAIVYLED